MLLIYEVFILIFLGEKAISKSTIQADDELACPPALLQDSMHLLSFHRKLLQVCLCAGAVGNDAVTLRDILAPTPKRTRLILSALINFCKFRQERMVLFEECTDRTEALIRRRDELEGKLQDLTDKVNSVRLARAEQQPLVQELRKLTSALAADLRELKKAQTALAQDMDQLKLEKSKIAEKLTNNSFLITNVKQDCARLSSRIVSDPAKLLQTIQDMNASVKADKQNVMMAERKSRELRARMDAMSAVEADLDECRALLGEAEQARQKTREASKAFSVLQDSFGRKQNVLRDLEIKEQQHARQEKQASDKLGRLFAHQSSRQTANQSRKEKLDSQLAANREQYEKAVNLSQDTAIQVEGMVDETRALEKTIQDELAALTNAFNRLVTQVGAYQTELAVAMV
ncbi:kinetochore-associated Ndc80 complex subunit nuf2 [Kappamyces sp. JEL0829]|nr:kinetochore-associated Ndc80 complex subunit nuf2 [Kappamyces sp. JEL0829]